MSPRTKNLISVIIIIAAVALTWFIMTRPWDRDEQNGSTNPTPGVITYQEGDTTVFQLTLEDGDVVKHYTKNGDKVRITNLEPWQEVRSPLTVRGEAVGGWFFEASFPIRFLDRNGREIAVTPAQAQGEWMTSDFVPFEATLTFDAPEAGGGYLILEKDNPSGLPEHAARYEFPVLFAAKPVAQNGCVITGCSGQVCADEEVMTTCIFLPEFACYRSATCARQANGECGWTPTVTLNACLASYGQ